MTILQSLLNVTFIKEDFFIINELDYENFNILCQTRLASLSQWKNFLSPSNQKAYSANFTLITFKRFISNFEETLNKLEKDRENAHAYLKTLQKAIKLWHRWGFLYNVLFKINEKWASSLGAKKDEYKNAITSALTNFLPVNEETTPLGWEWKSRYPEKPSIFYQTAQRLQVQGRLERVLPLLNKNEIFAFIVDHAPNMRIDFLELYKDSSILSSEEIQQALLYLESKKHLESALLFAESADQNYDSYTVFIHAACLFWNSWLVFTAEVQQQGSSPERQNIFLDEREKLVAKQEELLEKFGPLELKQYFDTNLSLLQNFPEYFLYQSSPRLCVDPSWNLALPLGTTLNERLNLLELDPFQKELALVDASNILNFWIKWQDDGVDLARRC